MQNNNRKTVLIQNAIEILKHSNAIFVLTGAGISAESGIPTFRGADGLWKNYSVTDLATPEAFARNPALVWEWYRWRREIILRAKPNAAHTALVEIEKKLKKFLLLTQNVDNLHQRAGSKNVLELHGNIFRSRCVACGTVVKHEIALNCSRLINQTSDSLENLPKCNCGGLLRPDVVWFGEPIQQDAWNQSLVFLNEADTAIICGTSGVVWPAAAIPQIAKTTGVKTIEINLEPTPITPIVDASLLGKASEILTEIVPI
jgi:NAD-dependent deacetylase